LVKKGEISFFHIPIKGTFQISASETISDLNLKMNGMNI